MRSNFLWLLLWGCFFSIESWAIESEVNWRSFTIIKDRGDGGIEKVKRHLNAEEKVMVDQAEIFDHPVFFYSVFKNDSDYYLVRDCYLNYWKWDGAKWVEQLDFDGVGSYCSANFFFYENQPYKIGTSGFWQYHADLYQLNPESKQPEFVQTSDQPDNYYSGLVFVFDTGVLQIAGVSFDRRKNIEHELGGSYFLDLEDKNWKKVTIDWTDKDLKDLFETRDFPRSRSVDTPSFGLFAFGYGGSSETSLLIIDKKTLEVYRKSIPFFDIVGVNGFLVSTDDEVIFLRGETSENIRLSLSQLKQEAELVGKISIQNEVFPYQNGMYFIVVSVLIGGIVGTWFWRKKKLGLADEILSQEPDSMALDERIFPFLDVQETIISQEKMDELLGLEHGLAFDLRKVHRARKIREINELSISQFGYPLITRERHTMDRRMILYCIGKIFIDKDENKKILAKT